MMLVHTNLTALNAPSQPDVISLIITGTISIVVAIISSVMSYQLARKKSRDEIEQLRTSKQLQLNLEIDKMQAEAFYLLFEPLKYIAKNANCPFAMFRVDKTNADKHTVLIRNRAIAFLDSINAYLFGPRGSLFLPRDLRNSLFALRGIISDLIKEENSDEITLNDEKTIQHLNDLISGENNIHKQLRILMGTEDRKPLNNLT